MNNKFILVNITIFFFIIFTKLLHAQNSTYYTGGNICSNQPWVLVFDDEFDGDSLDKSKWITWFPYSASGNDSCEFCRTHGDDVDQVYLDSNVVVSNGTLKLIAKKQTATWFTATRDYTSGMIQSRGLWMYGLFEMRCKIPYGEGFDPAFWLFGGGHGTEIDDFEIGGQRPNYPHMNCLLWGNGKVLSSFGANYTGVDYSQDFHVFSVEWEPFYIIFRIDGNQVFEITRFYTISGDAVTWCCVDAGVYNVQPAFPQGENNTPNIIANLGVGNSKTAGTGAPNSSTVFPSQFEIDYIRVYQRDTSKIIDTDCQVLLFPNPVTNDLFIESNNMTSIKIENVLGQILYSSSLNTNETEVNVSTYGKGVYIVIVQTSNGVLVNKFIKY
jgi:beta-glucanase (GH16 family)